ncbi:hypothetical protein MBLNU230_g8584t1 [Neophaeotheca triangularis]
MSRTQMDQYIFEEDEEETCPLCVEELDVTDQGFRPCPCGYQICQFCYHNVKTNMNGLCPACRRPYNDKDIEYKVITPEEAAAHKLRQAQKQKKAQSAAQKEKQKAEADSLSRKHLAGLRVVQKNLVYVTGLSPSSQEDKLLATLRGDQYFGQYGKIIKIVVSKAKDPTHPQSVGIYVTYERKEDAATCIRMVDGSDNGDRTLRAQFGTTKYCSAYLRGETCTNRNCMFLHEPGEANESYSRADLSSLNANTSQAASRQPPPQSQQPVASASSSQPMQRQPSDQPSSPAGERPALPSTASWASRPPQAQQSRTESRSTSGTVESPAPAKADPVSTEPEPSASAQDQFPVEAATAQDASAVSQATPKQTRPKKEKGDAPLLDMLKTLTVDDFRFVFSPQALSETDAMILDKFAPLFDHDGGAKKRARKQREEAQQEREEEQRRQEQELRLAQQQQIAAGENEDNPEMSGSMQLGGEPEERQGLSQISASPGVGQDSAIDPRFHLSGVASPAERGLTPQQHQQLLLQTMRGAGVNQGYANATQPGPQPSQPPGHQRNVSRFSFANDTASASTAVKPVANPKLMNQQSSMMPSAGAGNHFGNQHQAPNGQFFTSNVQGPPPGLKTTGTPPVSGGMTFSQGHNFTTGGLQYGVNSATSRNANEEMMRSLLRGGRDPSMAQNDAAKREYPSYPNYTHHMAQAASPQIYGPNNHAPYASLSAFGSGSEGEKQRKKKGKKHHRGANTSSSSMSGSVDDHMLQARLQQGGLGVYGGAAAGGLGAYGNMHGGGGYGDVDFPPLGPPSRTQSISLNEPISSRVSTPPVPPGFEHIDLAAVESRRSTPSVPPGLTKPTALPDLEGTASSPSSRAGSRPSSRAGIKRTTSQITPVLPLRPSTPAQAKPSNEKGTKEDEKPTNKDTTEEESSKAPFPDPIGTKEEARSKSTAVVAKKVESEIKKENAQPSQPLPTAESTKPAATSKKTAVEPKRDISSKANVPAKEPKEPKPEAPATPKTAAKVVQQTPAKDDKAVSTTKAKPEEPKPEESKPETGKRKHPGKLDITAAVSQAAVPALKEEKPIAKASPASTSTPKKSQPASNAQTPSGISAPPSPGASSPAVRNVPKTLRVVQTPKAEEAPTQPTAQPVQPALPTPSAVPAAFKMPSRQPSMASMNQPDTPSSEHISDNISMASAPISRANSPPPGGKVGSAPVRAKTKNQMKKDRQERAKAIEEERLRLAEEEKEKNKAADEAYQQQEAIVSRKKKTKKEKEPKTKAKAREPAGTADTTPTASRPASPGPKPSPVVEVAKEEVIPESTTPPPKTPTQAPQVQPPTERPTSPPTPTLTPAAILDELKSLDPGMQRCLEAILRTPHQSPNVKAPHPITAQDISNPVNSAFWNGDFKVSLTKNEIDALLKEAAPAVHYSSGGNRSSWGRGVVTPTGAHLRALTEELEQRFLELEAHMRTLPEELRFHTTKPQNELGFPALDLDTMKRAFLDRQQLQGRGGAWGKSGGESGRGVSVMEQMVQDGGSKKGAFLVDEAQRYINEFVMPPAASMAGANGRYSGAEGQVEAGAQDEASRAGAAAAVRSGVGERQMADAKRVGEERENALRKMIKKNKKLLGLA